MDNVSQQEMIKRDIRILVSQSGQKLLMVNFIFCTIDANYSCSEFILIRKIEFSNSLLDFK